MCLLNLDVVDYFAGMVYIFVLLISVWLVQPIHLIQQVGNDIIPKADIYPDWSQNTISGVTQLLVAPRQ